jgi:hypothetical protein
MLFVLGLFLIAVGIGISTITQTVIVTTQTTIYGIPVQYPHPETIQPYVGIGSFMVLLGIIALVVAFIMTLRKRERTVKMTVETPKT